MVALYIAGPMTGYPEYNYPAFNAAEERLRTAGYDTLNPTINHNDGWEWTDYLRAALAQVINADGIAVLPEWETSRGAQLEVHVAHGLSMPVKPLNRWLTHTP